MTISEKFGELGITITKAEIALVEKMAVHFALRKTHPLTFGSMYLGVHPVAFTTADYHALFDVFGVKKTDVETAIRSISAINTTYAVTSDPYNLLTMWLCHLASIYIKDAVVRRQFMTHVLRLYHYKIFCSVVNNSFRHGAKQDIQDFAIQSLTLKSDIIKLESWGALINSHVDKILDPQDRFYTVLVNGGPDDQFLRVIIESQTALRAKIVTFAKAYYTTHATGDAIRSRSAIAETKEGERIIAQSASVIDSSTKAMIAEVLNPNMIVHDLSIQGIVAISSSVSATMLKTALLRINETAVLQTGSRRFDKVDDTKDGVVYVGVGALISAIIRSMVKTCRTRRVNLAVSAEAFKTMRDAMSASRILDPDILAIKRSVGQLVDSFQITNYPAAQSALRLAVIYYILYRTIQKMRAS